MIRTGGRTLQLQTGTVVERYTIEGVLGSGGMATVYLARHNQIGSLHALKVLQILTPSIRERLLQEGRVQGAMRHSHIVAVTDLVQVDGMPALVLEYVRGPSLAQLLSSRRPSLAQADELARGILRGAAFAHRHGLIHRDLKPGNILLAIADGVLHPKITDFGLAKIMEGPTGRHETRTGVGLGTPSYMAPEQIRDAAHVDQRADVFSLGAILFQLVTGRLAFDGPDKMEIFSNICEGRFENPRALAPDVPERMVRAIEEALRVDVDDRPADAAALLALWAGEAEGLRSDPLVSTPGDAWTEEILRSAEQLAPTDESLSGAHAPTGEPTFAVSLEFTPGPAQPRHMNFSEASSLAPTEAPPEVGAREITLASLGAMITAAPFLLGTLVVVFGTLSAVLAAPYVWPMVAVSLLGIAAVGAFSQRLPGSVAPWLVAPTLVAVMGNIISAKLASDALVQVEQASVAERALLAATGQSEALAAEMAAMALTTFVLLAVADGAALIAVFRLSPRFGALASPRRLATAGVAGLGSTALWLTTLGQTDGPGSFVVFAMLFACGLSAAAIAFPAPDADPRLSRTRLLVGLGATLGVLSAAKVVFLQELTFLFSAVSGAPADRLAAAEGFSAAFADTRIDTVLMWGSTALLASAIPFLGVGRPRKLAWVKEAGLLVALLLPLLASKYSSDNSLTALSSTILPAFLDEEADRLLGMRLSDSERESLEAAVADVRKAGLPASLGTVEGQAGATVVDPGASELRAGDLIFSLEDRPVAGVRDLLGQLQACRCGDDEGCALSGCVRPGTTLAVTVLRDGAYVQTRLALPFGDPGAVTAPAPSSPWSDEGLSFERPANWYPKAGSFPVGEGRLITVTTEARADSQVQIQAYINVPGAHERSVAAFSETTLAEWLGEPPDELTETEASGRVVLGAPSEVRAVTVSKGTSTFYLEFHRVSIGDRELQVFFSAPAGQRGLYREPWNHILDTLAFTPELEAGPD
ncbi:MAG: protein kinase [Proteobacteria bacterium]|nr:protein kinase [Pseudomonadota bacterium]